MAFTPGSLQSVKLVEPLFVTSPWLISRTATTVCDFPVCSTTKTPTALRAPIATITECSGGKTESYILIIPAAMCGQLAQPSLTMLPF